MDKADRIIKINESISRVQQLNEIAPLIAMAVRSLVGGVSRVAAGAGRMATAAKTKFDGMDNFTKMNLALNAAQGAQAGYNAPTTPGAMNPNDTSIAAPAGELESEGTPGRSRPAGQPM
jgi:hypothetical protein